MGVRAGVLNPSDWQALHPDIGAIGLNWDSGHIALEEVMATKTTLLFQHKGMNPELFTPARLRTTALYPGLVEEALAVDPEPP